MHANLVRLTVAIVATMGITGASAAPLSISRIDRAPMANSIREGAPSLAPLPFLRFCQKYPSQCGGRYSESYVELDGELWDTIKQVNRAVNSAISPRDDTQDDTWDLGAKEGDCDDYAVEKRRRLIALGFSPAVLALTEVTARGEGHLVLTIRTDRGALVLDNLRDSIVSWNSTGYQFVRMQSAHRPDYWVAVGGAVPSPLVLAARNAKPAIATKAPIVEAVLRSEQADRVTVQTVKATDLSDHTGSIWSWNRNAAGLNQPQPILWLQNWNGAAQNDMASISASPMTWMLTAQI